MTLDDKIRELFVFQAQHAEAERSASIVMGLPARWYDPPGPKWRCINGHVSTSYLKSELLGRDTCLRCFGRIVLTFPEDVEMPLHELVAITDPHQPRAAVTVSPVPSAHEVTPADDTMDAREYLAMVIEGEKEYRKTRPHHRRDIPVPLELAEALLAILDELAQEPEGEEAAT